MAGSRRLVARPDALSVCRNSGFLPPLRRNRIMPRRRHDIPADKVDFKNPEILSQFTTQTGKILPRRVTGVSAKLHRKITREIKRARHLALLPYTGHHIHDR